MCYLAKYHPGAKVWRMANEKTLDENHFYAVVHTGLHTTKEIAPVACQVKWDGISLYILDKEHAPRCELCEEILQSVSHNGDKDNQ
jgi:hypothetical protein